jgi:hypothetical protein
MPVNNTLRRFESPAKMMLAPSTFSKLLTRGSPARRPAAPIRMSSDEWSTSSTMTASPSLTKRKTMSLVPAADPAAAKVEGTKRRVNFDLTQNKSYNNTQLHEEDIAPLWYSGNDMLLQRSKAKKTATEIVKMEKENTSALSYRRVLQRTFHACTQCAFETDGSILTLVEEKRLAKRMREGPIRLGLERLSIRNIGLDRFDRRSDMRKVVFSIQQAAIVADGTIFTDHTAEKIRLACEELSRPSRLFARHMAVALFPKTSTYCSTTEE